MSEIPALTSCVSDLDISELRNRALAFGAVLKVRKAQLASADFGWYPYDTLGNFTVLARLLTGVNRCLCRVIGGGPVLDIGAADGDLAFFMESLGYRVQVIDYGPTNFNGLRGLRSLKQGFPSAVEIHELDLDAQFRLPADTTYGLVFFLGILYHLKNPFYALQHLAKAARYCLISTRIAKFNPDKQTNLSQIPVAYLLDDLECNRDASNYWIFSDAGLRRILKRTGWDICDYITVGDTKTSDPASQEGDERAFCLVKSRFVQ